MGTLEKTLHTPLASTPTGLSSLEATALLERFGRNVLPTGGVERHVIRQIARNFTHFMALLLWFGGGLAFLAAMPQLGVAIWAVNLVNGTFGAWQQHRAYRALQALQRLLPQKARVIRDGREVQIEAESVVPGDSVVISEGDRVPADIDLIDSAALRLDQSLLTGESTPISKNHGETAYAGSYVAGGHGTGIARQTGATTEFGRVAVLTQTTAKQLSPLEKELIHTTRVITLIAVLAGVAFLLLAVAFTHLSLISAAVYALGVIVAFVPEGLLPTLTVSLALGAQRMAARRALVKELSTVETLGSTTVICTDKTGTLTQNQMTVRRLWAGGEFFRVTGTGYSGQGAISAQHHGGGGIPRAVKRLIEIGVTCNNTRLLPPDGGERRWRVLGDPTEAALLVLAGKAGFDTGSIVRRYPRLAEIPFDSDRRRMTTLHGHDGETLVFLKGAFDQVLPRCDKVWGPTGITPLTPERTEGLQSAERELAGNGQRVLAFAFGVAASPDVPEECERHLTFVGMVAMEDPPRPEVPSAIATCRTAGVRVVMMTGDREYTARSIARQIGLISDSDEPRLVTGQELDGMSEEDLASALAAPVLFARVRPEHKLRVVECLQRQGHVVAVTGDGVNDAPALKRADIGVAMGASGSDVAREASDLILLDDSFASIVNAIEEGRTVFANVRRFSTYVFTSNAPEAVPFIAFALSGGRIPPALDVMRILAVDLGTDVMPAVALGTEPPAPGLMVQRPRRPDEHLIDRALLVRAYLWLGIPQSLAVMGAFYFQYWRHGFAGQWLDLPGQGPLYALAASTALATVVGTQIGNLFTQRSEAKHRANRFLWIGVASEVALFLVFTHVPVLRNVLGVAPLDLAGWLVAAASVPVLPLADQLRKWAERSTAR